jgi:hypothetical protein
MAMMDSPPRFSFEAKTRPDIANFLQNLVAGDTISIEQLEPNKGDDEFGAISGLLSNASADARQVFGKALADVTHSAFEAEGETDSQTRKLRALDLLEIALAEDISLDYGTVLGTLRKSTEQDFDDVVASVSRVLSYFGSEPLAAKILQDLYIRNPTNPSVAAYLLTVRTAADVQSAFEMSFGGLDAATFGSVPELTLAIQNALWTMFDEDGRIAKVKVKAQSPSWPRPLTLLVYEILSDTPMDAVIAATQTARDLLRILQPTVEEPSVPYGVAARIIKRGAIVCYDGYSMRAAAGPGEFESYHVPWMTRLSNAVRDVVSQKFLSKNSDPLEVRHNKWPLGARWTSIIDSVTLEEFGPKREAAEGRPHLTSDICFEMFYIDRDRKTKYEVVELALLKTFSVLFHRGNTILSDALALDESAPDQYLDQYFRHASTGIVSFLKKIQTLQRAPHFISIPVFNAAGDLISNFAKQGLWKDTLYTYVDGPQELLEVIKNNPQSAIVICDNVTANVVWKRAEIARIFLQCARFKYPEPIPVGLVYDAMDQAWGDILQEAMEMTVADSSALVTTSLQEHFDSLEALDATPSGLLARAFRKRARKAQEAGEFIPERKS